MVIEYSLGVCMVKYVIMQGDYTSLSLGEVEFRA